MRELIGSLPGYLQAGSILAYTAAFAGGLLASFTPCVYPVIPVTVGFIAARSRGSAARGFLLTFAYVVGMAATYSVLGGAAALTGRVFGEVAASPASHLVLGAFCILFGLSLFDLFRIPLPVFSGRGGGAGTPSSVLEALGVGMVSGLVVGPCTAPVMGGLLLYVASRQNVALGMSLLFAFALGMGSLLILLGTFSGLLASLPKSGKWLLHTKRGFGAIMILSGGYYFYQAVRLSG